MPVIKSAKKKLRQDILREKRNDLVRSKLKRAFKKAKEHPSLQLIQNISKLADKAAKRHIIHKNKASRMKSVIAHLLPKSAPAEKLAKKPLSRKFPKTVATVA